MSRSRKRKPYLAICGAPTTTAKRFKRRANRLFRRWERADIRAGREPYVSMRITMDPRLMAYDDKRYVAHPPTKAMRK